MCFIVAIDRPAFDLVEVLDLMLDNSLAVARDVGPKCTAEDGDVRIRNIIASLMKDHEPSVQRGFSFKPFGLFKPCRKGFLIKFMASQDEEHFFELRRLLAQKAKVFIIIHKAPCVTPKNQKLGANGDLERRVLLVDLEVEV